MVNRIRKAMDERDQGFTLIELLVVIIIVGVLAAIAIPVFLNQRKKGVDAGLKSDLKSMATLQETYITDNPTVGGRAIALVAAGGTATVSATNDFKASAGNQIEVTLANGGYCVSGFNAGASVANATGARMYYDSLAGGLQPTTFTAATATTDACA